MTEGFAAAEAGSGVVGQRTATSRGEQHGPDRTLSIIEAALLALVALLAAWSGYASARWSTESRLELSRASTARTEANRSAAEAAATIEFDASTFNDWFTAYSAGNVPAMRIAEHRFRPEFQVAFDAWWATNPETNPNAPKGPTYMPQYEKPDVAAAAKLDAEADAAADRGASAAAHADDYVRITVFLATVLFLVGISGHFRFRAARYGLISVAVVILLLAGGFLATAPQPPG